MPRVAVLISHARQEPFISIIQGFDRPSKLEFAEFTFDLFYFEGLTGKNYEKWLRTNVEKLRYTSLWPILRIYDTFFLWLGAMNTPIAKLEYDEIGRRFLKTRVPEDQRHIAAKVYSVLSFCKDNDYDFVLRTTSNSIFNLKLLTDLFRENTGTDLFYAGREVNSFNRPSFISGSFTILNRNAIRFLLKQKRFHNFGVLDDVAIGRIFARTREVLRKEFSKSADFSSLSSVESFPECELPLLVHYRCKSSSTPRDDLAIMLKLKQLLCDNEVPYF